MISFNKMLLKAITKKKRPSAGIHFHKYLGFLATEIKSQKCNRINKLPKHKYFPSKLKVTHIQYYILFLIILLISCIEEAIQLLKH